MIAPDRHPPMAPWLEQAWLMRYLDRQLGADEQAWFEGYLLDKPDLLDQVEADTALRDAVAAHQGAGHASRPGSSASGSTADGAGTSPASRVSPAIARNPTTPPVWRQVRWSLAALAASVVGGFGLAWLGVGLLDERGAAPVANPSRIIFDTLRGSLTDPRIETGDPASPVMLVEFPVPPGARILSVQASVPQGLVAMDLPVVAADGYATYVVPSTWRGHGTLTIQLQEPGSAQPSTMELPL